jgi:hypothetical protein
MSEKNEKVFRGVWIPAEIWEAHILSWMEKCLWAEISSLGTEEKPCFASNAFLAKKFNSTESSISNMISRLRSLNMVKQVSYDGRSRKMVAILPNQTSPTSEVRVHPQVKSDSTHGCNIDTSEVTKGELPLTPSRGNGDSLQAANAANGADAQVGKADALSSRPPNSVSTRTPFRAPKSPPTKPADISDETWAAWCDLRKAKRAAVTAPVLAMLRKEADKAGWSLNSAMEECVLRNWQGFKADWLQRVHKQESQTSLL